MTDDVVKRRQNLIEAYVNLKQAAIFFQEQVKENVDLLLPGTSLLVRDLRFIEAVIRPLTYKEEK